MSTKSAVISSGTIPVPEEAVNFLRSVIGQILEDADDAVESIGVFTPYEGVPHTEQDRIATAVFKDVVFDFFPRSPIPATNLNECELWAEPSFDMGTFFQRCAATDWTTSHGRQ